MQSSNIGIFGTTAHLLSAPAISAIICLCAIGTTEFALRRGATAKSVNVGAADRSTSLQIVLGYLVSVVLLGLIAPFLPLNKLSVGGRWAAVALAGLGLALRWWSMGVLGRFYTRTSRTVVDQELVQYGPYRLIRHHRLPLELGNLDRGQLGSGSSVSRRRDRRNPLSSIRKTNTARGAHAP
jgi:isoprenylcysteine carboxyl methyltransferase (ICMT) family protein YpbQ